MTLACTRCHRPCVPGRIPDDRVPEGHVHYHAKGLCRTCYSAEGVRRRGRPDPCRLAACVECGAVRQVRIRPGYTGLCRTCFHAARADTLIEDTAPEEAELTCGRWVKDHRGILVWREDVAS